MVNRAKAFVRTQSALALVSRAHPLEDRTPRKQESPAHSGVWKILHAYLFVDCLAVDSQQLSNLVGVHDLMLACDSRVGVAKMLNQERACKLIHAYVCLGGQR